VPNSRLAAHVPYKVHFVVASLPRLDANFFRTSLGNEPVREWLLSLSKENRKAVGTDIAYVQYKWPLGRPHVDHLRGSVWEVRSSLKGRIARVLFAVDGKEMVLLHGFIKKSQRTPSDDLALAEARWREWCR
jgi:phage-related protein